MIDEEFLITTLHRLDRHAGRTDRQHFCTSFDLVYLCRANLRHRISSISQRGRLDEPASGATSLVPLRPRSVEESMGRHLIRDPGLAAGLRDCQSYSGIPLQALPLTFTL